MTKQVQRRRGTATQHTSFTGAEGEISVNTTNKSVHVHDGTTAGGIEAARADLGNVSAADILSTAGITATTTELNYTDGVTSGIQAQLDAKAPINSATLTGTTTIATADINGGTIDGTSIGATTAAAGSFTSLTASGTFTATSGTIDGVTIGGTTPAAVTTTSLTATTADINGGTIDGTVIGGTTAAAITGTTITGTSFASSGNMTFGDNNKAIFGAGSDLKIYHDGSNSYIDDVGTGNLRVRAEDLRLEDTSSNRYLQGAAGGSTTIYYAGSAVASTSATGFDVNGTITADGLTVDGVSTFTSNVFISHNATPLLRLEDTDTALDFDLLTAGSNATIRTKNGAYPLLLQTNELNRVLVSGGGNISFYEDTGTTAKLFWDASDEQLMLGTTTDTNSLDSSLILQGGGANAYGKLFIANENTTLGSTDAIGFVGFGDANKLPSSFIGVYADGTWTSGSSQPSRFSISTTPAGSASSVERLRIDSSGNLLVGLTSSTDGTSIGCRVREDGFLAATREGTSSQPTVVFNKKTNDGEIAQFQKDGTEVGNIGTYAGSPYIGADDTGISFFQGVNAVVPFNTATVSEADNSIDLGRSAGRFKDAHFAGTVNAANFNTTSDAALKTNVETLNGSLDAVMSMRGVSFDWIESGKSEVGVIAQEVEEVIPDLVNTNEQGIKSVKYGNMVAVLIEAIKDQQKQIDELKAQLNS